MTTTPIPDASTARRLFRKLPPGMRETLRTWRSRVLEAIPGTTERWIRTTYTRFGGEQRRRIFLEIARFAHINRPIPGYYMEFGSHEANTMRMAWDTFHRLFDWTFIAFDSFEGLPEIRAIDQQEIWRAGKLKTGEDRFIATCLRHGVRRERLMTVKGFYDASLTPELAQRLQPRKAAVIYVDCDLYHSTIPVLEFIVPFLQPGTVIVFDDWNCFLANPDKGERLAWREFRERHPTLRFEDFVHTGMQKSFVYVG